MPIKASMKRQPTTTPEESDSLPPTRNPVALSIQAVNHRADDLHSRWSKVQIGKAKTAYPGINPTFGVHNEQHSIGFEVIQHNVLVWSA
jgi:hypothetical protein